MGCWPTHYRKTTHHEHRNCRRPETANQKAIREQFSIVLERTVQELNGIPCIELEEAGTPRQQIMVSRSFGSTVTEFDDLAESVSNFATKAAEKLRDDGSVAASVCVYVRTNPFKEDEPQYQRSMIVPLGQPSDDTMKLVIQRSLMGLKIHISQWLPIQEVGGVADGIAEQRILFRPRYSMTLHAGKVSQA